MGLVPKFTVADIKKQLDTAALEIEAGIIRVFGYIGEQFVSDARQALNISGAFPKGDYTDQTANLRSSIGYYILKDGVIINRNVEGTAEGILAANKVVNEVSRKVGYELIGVAGMDYASYVESKGYNVITSQADVAIVDLEQKLKKFRDRMSKKGASFDYDIIGDLVTTSTR
jgi:hypothetical protein